MSTRQHRRQQKISAWAGAAGAHLVDLALQVGLPHLLAIGGEGSQVAPRVARHQLQPTVVVHVRHRDLRLRGPGRGQAGTRRGRSAAWDSWRLCASAAPGTHRGVHGGGARSRTLHVTPGTHGTCWHLYCPLSAPGCLPSAGGSPCGCCRSSRARTGSPAAHGGGRGWAPGWARRARTHRRAAHQQRKRRELAADARGSLPRSLVMARPRLGVQAACREQATAG